MFASTDLAHRIERAEAALTEGLVGAVVGSPGCDEAFVDAVAGGVAAYAGPSSPMNKMIGLGFEGLPTSDLLAAVEDKFAARRAPLQAEVSTLADPALVATLSRRGYVLENFENVLGMPVEAAGGLGTRPGITITATTPSQAEDWLDAAIVGFQHADEQGVQAAPLPDRASIETAMRPFMAALPGIRRYCAWMDGTLAGVASLRLAGDIAQLCGAATLPQFRRRGIQTMLLQHRLSLAAANGCRIAVLTTQPGSRSQENGHRQGFALLYTRAIMVRPAADAPTC